DSVRMMRRPAIIAYAKGEARAYVELVAGMGEARLRIPRRYLHGEKTVQLDFVYDAMEPAGNLNSGSFKIEEDSSLTVNYRVPEFSGVHRPRNINWANYGDSTPDGHHIINPAEIFQIYYRLYTSRLEHAVVATARNERGLIGLRGRLDHRARIAG